VQKFCFYPSGEIEKEPKTPKELSERIAERPRGLKNKRTQVKFKNLT
jgi:hypothetical protein